VRFLVYGAGAVGGVVGARLHQAGHDVTLVARGEHARVMRESGLRLESPTGTETLPVPVLAPDRLSEFPGRAIVLLAVKSQDTAPALRDLSAAGVVDALVCLQNGVDNERMALRTFDDVYGVCVMLPAAHQEPGVVTTHASPITGILDLGRYPSGLDQRAVDLAAVLGDATFLSEPRADIMRWKYRKLVMNLGNAVQALCGRVGDDDPVVQRLEREAAACFEAAGVDVLSEAEDRARRADHIQRRPVAGRPRSGGSSYQSLERGQGTIETDYLNGEICLLGRRYGVPTPANAAVQRLANQAARERWAPGRLEAAELAAAVETALTST
jgi:2-dehydropantoate 2-reductase